MSPEEAQRLAVFMVAAGLATEVIGWQTRGLRKHSHAPVAVFWALLLVAGALLIAFGLLYSLYAFNPNAGR